MRFTDMCTARRQPWTRIGVVDAASGALEVQGSFTLDLDTLRDAWTATLPALFG
jgi:phosphoribosylformylglycinamidine synthase